MYTFRSWTIFKSNTAYRIVCDKSRNVTDKQENINQSHVYMHRHICSHTPILYTVTGIMSTGDFYQYFQ